jgi:hypothetical protein
LTENNDAYGKNDVNIHILVTVPKKIKVTFWEKTAFLYFSFFFADVLLKLGDLKSAKRQSCPRSLKKLLSSIFWDSQVSSSRLTDWKESLTLRMYE